MRACTLLVLLVGSAVGFQLPLDVEPGLDLDVDVKEYWELILDWLRSQSSQSGPGKVLMAKSPHASATDTQSHLSHDQPSKSSTILSEIVTALSMRQVSMKVVEDSPLDDNSDHRTISSFNVDGADLTDTALTERLVDMIAKQLKDAGVTSDDLTKFISNQTRQREFGEEQYPDDAENATTEDPDTSANSEPDEPDDADDETDKAQTNRLEESAGAQRLLRSSSPPADGPGGPPQPGGGPSGPAQPGGGPNGPPQPAGGPNGPAQPGGGPNGPAQPGGGPNGPAQPGGGPSGPAQPAGGPDVFGNGTDYFAWLDDVMKRVSDRMAKNGNTADEAALDERPGLMDGKQTRRLQGASRAGEKPDAANRDSSSGAQGFDDWKKAEEAHGGFDNIPKAVPMIVMSGNTYIKDIGNFRNTYQYGSLPVKVRTIEPNGNDSGLDLDDSAAGNGQNSPGTAHIESRNRDGNTRARDRLLTLTAQGSKVHGHDDGNTYHSKVHGHDDGDSRRDSSRRDQGGDDSSTYHSDVHGHDDGDSTGDNPRPILRASWGDVHGHDDGDSRGDATRGQGGDDGSTYHSDVHGHDDGDSRGDATGGQGGDDGSTYHSDVHGHDDGDSRGDSSNWNRRPVLKASWGGVHGHDDGSTNNSPVHGHDDGSTNNSPVHGHDDGSSNNSPVHGHDDGSSNNSPVHGHDDGSSNNSPVHGHDDGSSNNSPVHGHDDGSSNNSPVHGHDDGSSNNSPVHGHDDGGLMRAAAPQRASSGRTTSMTLMNVSLTVLGTALVVLAVVAFVTAKRMRLGTFRRQDYVVV